MQNSGCKNALRLPKTSGKRSMAGHLRILLFIPGERGTPNRKRLTDAHLLALIRATPMRSSRVCMARLESSARSGAGFPAGK